MAQVLSELFTKNKHFRQIIDCSAFCFNETAKYLVQAFGQ